MHAERYRNLSKALEHILHTLVTRYQPEKVILYGSMAANTVDEWSDIDLVIIKDTQLTFIDRLVEVARLCYTGIGTDYLVYTPGEFETMITEQNPFILQEVIRKGKILYEREPTRAVV